MGLIEKYHQLHKQLSNNFSGAILHISRLTTQSEAPEASTSTLCCQPGSHETETGQQLQNMELGSTPLSTDTGSQTLQAEPSSPSQSLRDKSVMSVQNFKNVVTSLHSELRSKAPTLLYLLMSCLKTAKPRRNTEYIVVVVVSILCKHRRPPACLIQRIISLSHTATVQVINIFGSDYDSLVLDWKESVQWNSISSQV